MSKGIRDEDIAMSVACIQMVESVASGVAYSRHPFNILEDDVLISAVWGLGPYAVDGVITPDSYKVAKNDALSILATEISHKPVQLVSNPDGGLMELPVEPELQDSPCLTPDQIRLLADYVVKLEKHYGCPQDTEWAVDGKGKLLILQTRPLRLESPTLRIYAKSMNSSRATSCCCRAEKPPIPAWGAARCTRSIPKTISAVSPRAGSSWPSIRPPSSSWS